MHARRPRRPLRDARWISVRWEPSYRPAFHEHDAVELINGDAVLVTAGEARADDAPAGAGFGRPHLDHFARERNRVASIDGLQPFQVSEARRGAGLRDLFAARDHVGG